eukprot:148098-Lingulodinium_polyedra.AAC.1
MPGSASSARAPVAVISCIALEPSCSGGAAAWKVALCMELGCWRNSGLAKEAIKFIDVFKQHLQATGEKASSSM